MASGLPMTMAMPNGSKARLQRLYVLTPPSQPNVKITLDPIVQVLSIIHFFEKGFILNVAVFCSLRVVQKPRSLRSDCYSCHPSRLTFHLTRSS